MERPDFELFFKAAPGLYVVLNRDFEIVAVTDAYLRATMTEREAILGRSLFDVFPDNPNDPAADGVRNLRASLERVLSTGKADSMAVQKYDIPRPQTDGGGFEVRYWSPRNFPVMGADGLACIIHRVEDVTEYVRLREAATEQAELRTQMGRMEAEILARSRELQESASELRLAKAKLIRLNEELEARVAERTRALESANAALHAEMQHRERAEEQFRQAQKMEAVGQLAGGIAHDFNNLLTVILNYASGLVEDAGLSEAGRADLRHIEIAAKRAAALTRQLLAFSRRSVVNPVLLNLNDVVRESAKLLRRIIGEHISLTLNCAPDLGAVLADRPLIEHVLMNLIVNARDAMPHGGSLTIETVNTELGEETPGAQLSAPPGRYVMLVVTDTGQGMTPEIQERIFLPFFTTKGVGKGTGLGLSMVHGVVKQSLGELIVHSRPGGGSTFKLYLPLAIEGPQLSPTPAAVGPQLKPTETLLLVEDEEQVRLVAKRVLERAGYTVIAASSPHEALSWRASHATTVHLVVTDVVMPGMDGPTFVRELACHGPPFRVLFMSGYPGDALVRQPLHDSHSSFLQKPFTPQSLLAAVREALAQEAGASS